MGNEKEKKPFYKRAWFWIIIGFVAIGATQVPSQVTSSSIGVTPTSQSVSPSAQAESTDSSTMGQRNALRKAKEYLYSSAFSKNGLIKQLEYEGFSTSDATYGAEHCNANWNEQAAKKAKDYLSTMSFSRSGLIDQLEYEGFLASECEYGVKAVGY